MPFWDSRDSLSAPDDVKADKLMLAKIGRWASLVCQTGDAEYGYLISQKTASLMLQPNAPRCVWKSPIMDDLASAQPNLQSVSDTLIHDMKTSSRAAKHLQGVNHTEMTTEHSTILNKVWPIYPQLRYCCSHLLAGAILVDGVKAILLNTIELYSRDSLSDAHYERRCRTQGIHYGSLTLSLASGNVRFHFLFRQTWWPH